MHEVVLSDPRHAVGEVPFVVDLLHHRLGIGVGNVALQGRNLLVLIGEGVHPHGVGEVEHQLELPAGMAEPGGVSLVALLVRLVDQPQEDRLEVGGQDGVGEEVEGTAVQRMPHPLQLQRLVLHQLRQNVREGAVGPQALLPVRRGRQILPGAREHRVHQHDQALARGQQPLPPQEDGREFPLLQFHSALFPQQHVNQVEDALQVVLRNLRLAVFVILKV